MKCFKLFLMASLFFLSTRGLTQKVSPQNLRLSCQDAVNGVLLARHDKLHLAEQTLAAYERKQMQNRSLLVLRQEELVKLRSERAKNAFDASLQKRNLVLGDAITKLTQQQNDLQSSIAGSMADREQAKRGYLPLLKDVKALFNIKSAKDHLTGQESIYGATFEYRRQCPKFEFVCKLNPDEVKKLEAIIQHEPEPLEPCKKYINQSA